MKKLENSSAKNADYEKKQPIKENKQQKRKKWYRINKFQSDFDIVLVKKKTNPKKK